MLTGGQELKEIPRDLFMGLFRYNKRELVPLSDGGQTYVDLAGEWFGYEKKLYKYNGEPYTKEQPESPA